MLFFYLNSNINNLYENLSRNFIFKNLKDNLNFAGWTEQEIYRVSLYLKEIYRFIVLNEGYHYDKMLISFLKFSQATGFITLKQATIAFEVFKQYLNNLNIKVEVINFYNLD